jgi:hypothetical protein
VYPSKNKQLVKPSLNCNNWHNLHKLHKLHMAVQILWPRVCTRMLQLTVEQKTAPNTLKINYLYFVKFVPHFFSCAPEDVFARPRKERTRAPDILQDIRARLKNRRVKTSYTRARLLI